LDQATCHLDGPAGLELAVQKAKRNPDVKVVYRLWGAGTRQLKRLKRVAIQPKLQERRSAVRMRHPAARIQGNCAIQLQNCLFVPPNVSQVKPAASHCQDILRVGQQAPVKRLDGLGGLCTAKRNLRVWGTV